MCLISSFLYHIFKDKKKRKFIERILNPRAHGFISHQQFMVTYPNIHTDILMYVYIIRILTEYRQCLTFYYIGHTYYKLLDMKNVTQYKLKDTPKIYLT